MSRARHYVRWIPALVWAAAIFSMSSVPGSRIPGRYGFLGHAIEYGILGVLLAFALARTPVTPSALIAAVTIASAYGITDEFHQSFVPLRTPDPLDWLVDTAAALVGASALYLMLRRRVPRDAESTEGSEDAAAQ